MRMIDSDRFIEWIQDLSTKGRILTVPDIRFICNELAKDTNVFGKWVSVKDRLPEKAGIYIIMHEPEQVRGFEGVLCVWFFRVRDGMDTPDMYGWEEPQGDCVELYLMDDENACPVCGTGAWVQYCPECGTKLTPRKG